MIDSAGGWGTAREGASGDHVLRTGDAGHTWRDVTPPEAAALSAATTAEAAAFFADAQLGYVAYIVSPLESAAMEIHFWRTSNGGQEWESGGQVGLSGLPEAAPVMVFGDVNVGWLLVEQLAGMGHHAFTLLRTQDGGRSWGQLAGPPESESTCHRTGLAFADASTGWMTGECPFDVGGGELLAVTRDGGATWQPLPIPSPSQAPDLLETALPCGGRSPRLTGPEVGSLVVACMPDSGSGPQLQSYLYTTVDGGITWQTQAFPGGELYLLDSSRGWALSNDIYWTEDGGANWAQISTVGWVGQFSFVDATAGWAVAQSGGETALVQTLDGGRTWELLEPVISP